MICGGIESVWPSDDKKFDLWGNGVVLSFDFVVESLKTYYSKTSPQRAYDVIKSYLEKNGFEHLKDSDYRNENIDDVETADLLYHFSCENKWFPYCVRKMDISPNVEKLDVSRDIWAFRDEEWAEQHLAQECEATDK
jgi:virulence-associated protein VapD